jgi:hypothetical protein
MPAMIRTYPTRTMIDLEYPDPAKIHIEDVAHSLAMTCRYAGHCCSFYSTAEHSLLVERLGRVPLHPLLPRELFLAFLLHDAAEAYLGDVTSPLKSLLADYRELEARWEAAVRERFSLPDNELLRWKVGSADRQALLAEQHVLCWDASLPDPDLDVGIACWSPAEAERRFLHRFHVLGGT